MRLLIADDNADVAESLALLLGTCGHETRVACDGLQALEVAPAFRPDAVILDIDMPRVGGLEAARRLRCDRGRTLGLIAISGRLHDERRLVDAGFDVALRKPVAFDKLQAAVASVAPAARRRQ